MKKFIAVTAVVMGLALVGMGSTAEAGRPYYGYHGSARPYYGYNGSPGYRLGGHHHHHHHRGYRAPVLRSGPVYGPAYVAPYAPLYAPVYRPGVSIGIGVYPGY